MSDASLMEVLFVTRWSGNAGIAACVAPGMSPGAPAYSSDEIERASQILSGVGLMNRLGNNAYITEKGAFLVDNGWPVRETHDHRESSQ